MSDRRSFSRKVNSCSALQEELKEALDVIADQFDEQQRKLDIAKLTLANTGIVGGVLTIVGLALAPVTFGASLGLSIAGGIVGGGSAVGSISSLIADKIITKKSLKTAETKMKEYSEKTETIRCLQPKMLETLKEPEKVFLQGKIENSNLLGKDAKKNLIGMMQFHAEKTSTPTRLISMSYSACSGILDVAESIIIASVIISKAAQAGKVMNGMATAAKTVASTANLGKAIGTAADVGTDVASTAGKAGAASTGKAAAVATGKVAASGVKVAGMVTAGAGLALDLGAVIYYSHKIHKNKPSELAEKIRKVSRCLADNH